MSLPGGNQVDGLPPACKFFVKKLSFSGYKPIFSDFVLINIGNAEAHARGFAYL